MKSSLKANTRLFSKHIVRFFTIVTIVLVCVGFMYGIMEVESRVDVAANQFYNEQNVSDIYVKSENQTGFTKAERDYFIERYGEENVCKSLCYEVVDDDKITRIYNYDLTTKINELEVIEGELPTTSSEIAVERETVTIEGYNLQDKVTIMGREYTVTAIVFNPQIIITQEEPSFLPEEDRVGASDHVQRVFYINGAPFITNDVYIKIDNDLELFSNEYKAFIEEEKAKIELDLASSNLTVLTLYENAGLYSLNEYANKVSLIGIVFVVVFCLVVTLVIYSTMSRLIDEERGQMACQKTLGFTDGAIITRYMAFVLVAVAMGVLLALALGTGFTYIIYVAFNFQYAMPAFPMNVDLIMYLGFALGMLVVSFITVYTVARKKVSPKPAELLKPKAPKMGKRIFLEHIPFIWKHLSFKYKSTLRNVFLFKSRFIMTVVSIIFSSVLVFAGFGVLDCATKTDGADSLVTIGVAIIAFSAVLCALVIYNLTNINISEREREIATLMVLGYHKNEVSGYIYREIYIMAVIGALLGVPTGYGFIEAVFSLIDFGTVADINWWSWVIAPVLTVIFAVISSLLLRGKIVKTDMNSSLKTLE